MEHCKGPANQFIALVGDEDGKVREKLNENTKAILGEKDCYFISTNYYSAKYGVKSFAKLADVVADYDSKVSAMMCLFVVFKSIDDLKLMADVAKKIEADMRVLIIASSCPDSEEVENVASLHEIEVVYLEPTEEQIEEAAQFSEKLGIDRLIETMQVCNWPWRAVNTVGNSVAPPLTLDAEFTEYKMEAGDIITGQAADLLMRNYEDWFAQHPEMAIPDPQQAERVHLSPDSPTTTEGTANPDDVSISVDIDLVCSKSREETDGDQQKQKLADKPKDAAKEKTS